MEKSLPQWLDRILIGLFHFGALTLPLVFSFTTEELFEFNKMLFVYFWASCVGLVWFATMVVKKKVVFPKTPFDIPILIFSLGLLFATIFSIHPYTSLFGYYSRFHGGLLSYVAYILLFYAFVATFSTHLVPQSQAKQQTSHSSVLKWLISLFVGTTIAALYALPEHFGHSFSCQLATGTFGVDCWVQDVQARIFGSFGQPNWLAAYMILVIPIAISVLITIKNRWLQFSLASATVLWYAVLLFTKSRSGLLGMYIGLFVLALWSVLLYMRSPNMKKMLFGKKSALGMGTVLAIIMLTVVLGTPFTPSLLKKPAESIPARQVITGPALEVGGTESGEIRKIVWQGAIDIWKRYPLFGSGLETFAYSYYQSRPLTHNMVSEWDFLYNRAHNEWLNVLATTGSVGFLGFLGLLFSPYIVGALFLIKPKSKPTETVFFSVLTTGGILAGLSALHISNFLGFSTVAVTTVQFLLMGVLVVLWNHEHPKSADQTNTSKFNLGLTQYSILAGLVILFLILSANIYTIRKADVNYAKGKALIQQGNVADGAEKILSAISSRQEESAYYITLGSYYANIATQLFNQNQATDAATLAEQSELLLTTASKLNPVHYTQQLSRAGAYMHLGVLNPIWLEKALIVVDDLKQLAPTDPRPWILEGRILAYQESYPEAIKSLQVALEMKPNHPDGRSTLGNIYELTNQTESALAEYRYILENISPNDSLTLQKVASLEARLQ